MSYTPWGWRCAVVFALIALPAFALPSDEDGDGVDDAVDVCCGTPPQTPVDEDGRPLGDIDLDCDTDLDDVALLWESYTGPLEPCAESQCETGYLDCDHISGCETQNSAEATTCFSAENMGLFCGDHAAGPVCSDSNWTFVGSATGQSSAWLTTRVQECSSCCGYIEHRFTLFVPQGVDYDLYVYRDCYDTHLDASSRPAGQSEHVIGWYSDDCGASDNSGNLWIQVRYRGGQSCEPWRLDIEAH